jgi:hypothetical protein
MMRGLGLLGAIALAFGAIPVWISDELGPFSLLNFGAAALLLGLAVASGFARLGHATAPAYRGVLVRGLLGLALAIAGAVALERVASASGVQWDWSLERRYELSPAVTGALEELGRVEALLYYDDFDPRIRSTRLLLETAEKTGHLRFAERRIDAHADEEDCFAIGSSNTIVVTRDLEREPCQRRFERIERPTEGTLYEALYRLRDFERRPVWIAQGAGDGDPGRQDASGYSGLAQALATEGYLPTAVVLASVSDVPAEVAAVILLDPQRAMPPNGLAALERYLEHGGRLVAFLEPGVEAGLGELLARWGIESPAAMVIDPAAAALEGVRPGTAVLAHFYDARHPVARGLDSRRMTLLRGARSFTLRKPEPRDEMTAVVVASGDSWLATDPAMLAATTPDAPPAGARLDYHPLVVAGRYPRAGGEARIVAFGDSDLASNAYLRSLYNLDLVLNAVHWATEREPEITLRPKVGLSGRLQFPIPLQNTLTLFESLGLVVPQTFLMIAAVVWLRRRG